MQNLWYCKINKKYLFVNKNVLLWSRINDKILFLNQGRFKLKENKIKINFSQFITEI